MVNYLYKITFFTLIFVVVFSLDPQNDKFGLYVDQACCPQGFNKAQGKYCVQCIAPKIWNPKSQKCQNCPLPRLLIGQDCICPPPKISWNPNALTCTCPTNTFGDNCIYCPQPRLWDFAKKQCRCRYPFVWDGQNCSCQKQYFLYQEKCVNCPKGFAWKQNKCQRI